MIYCNKLILLPLLMAELNLSCFRYDYIINQCYLKFWITKKKEVKLVKKMFQMIFSSISKDLYTNNLKTVIKSLCTLQNTNIYRYENKESWSLHAKYTLTSHAGNQQTSVPYLSQHSKHTLYAGDQQCWNFQQGFQNCIMLCTLFLFSFLIAL